MREALRGLREKNIVRQFLLQTTVNFTCRRYEEVIERDTTHNKKLLPTKWNDGT